MAWNKKYRMAFQSFNGTQYAVYIYEQDYTGSLIELQGAGSPFVTREDDSTDIFQPLRAQTGYLRVIDPDGSLMEALMPVNSVEKLVRLFTGTWNSDYTEFTETSVKWQGFIQAQSYTQPWDNQTNIVEFPVTSLLGSLENIEIAHDFTSMPIPRVLLNAFSELLPSEYFPFTSLTYIGDAPIEHAASWLSHYVDPVIFFTEETVNNQGDSQTELNGISYYEALSSLFSLYGLTLREDGDTLVVAQYDHDELDIHSYSFDWEDIMHIAYGNWPSQDRRIETEDVDMLDTLIFKSINNSTTYLQGACRAIVKLNVAKYLMDITLPPCSEDSTAVIIRDSAYKSDDDSVQFHDVLIQPHGARIDTEETFVYSLYSGTTYVRTSSYSEMKQHSLLGNTADDDKYWDPHTANITDIVTGAFPVRWSHETDPDNNATLKNGLFLNTQYMLTEGTSFASRYCYTIQSQYALYLRNGYININMLLNSFVRIPIVGAYRNMKTFADDGLTFYDLQAQNLHVRWRVALSVGDKWWDGAQWISNTNGLNTFFYIDFYGRELATNKEAIGAVADIDDGYFVPVKDMQGVVSFHLLNLSNTQYYGSLTGGHSKIIEDLSITYIEKVNDVRISNRNQNTYMSKIASVFMQDERTIELNYGTRNNNPISPSLAHCPEYGYFEALPYLKSGVTQYVRPEMLLLNRMAAHYGKVRRTYKTVVQQGIDVMNTRYIYLDRTFVGIKASTDWREDEEEIEFLEVE